MLPLNVWKIKAVAAMFKAGHYTSFSNYASRAKTEHIDQFHVHGVPWSEELTVELKGGLRSITRGKGPAKQSFPVDLLKVIKCGVSDAPTVDGGPVGMTDLLIIGTYFMARELEIACARCGHFSVDVLAAEVTWNMPVTKNDTQALGTHRTWGCLCNVLLNLGCPFHAALRQLERVRAIASEDSRELAAMPFFPDIAGQVVAKHLVVSSLNKVMQMCGLPLQDALGRPMYGGHSMRTGGAVLLFGMGVDTTRIEAMARWNSPMLLYYIRSAPLKSITAEFKKLVQSRGSGLESSFSSSQPPRSVARAVHELSAKLDKAVAIIEDRDARMSALEATQSPVQYIRNCASDVWHFTRAHRAGQLCYTACGWQYTGMHFDVMCELPNIANHKQFCGTCLPAHRLRAMMT